MAFKAPQGKALTAGAAVDRLPAEVHDTPGYWLMRMADFMESVSKTYNKKRERIAADIGVPNDKGGVDFPTVEMRIEFSKREQALADEEIELPFNKVSIKDLQRSEGSQYEVPEDRRPRISPGLLRALKPFLLMPDEAEPAAPVKPPAKKP